MRAVVQTEFGGSEVLRLTDVDAPEPFLTEVQVQVHAIGVNPVDAKAREGRAVADAMGGFPMTVGWDVAGVVSKLGTGVNRFAIGDRVFGMPWFPRAAAGYAEYVTAPSRQLVQIPDALDFATAASIPLPATTAYQLVVDVAQVSAGDRVLVLAAGGTVGRLAVQIAKERGAFVIGTDSADRVAAMLELGMDEGIDFAQQEFDEVVADVDIVIDLVGGEHGRRAVTVTKPGGLVIGVPSGEQEGLKGLAEAHGVRATSFIVEPDRVALEHVSRMIAEGSLAVSAPEVWDFEQVQEVHDRLAIGAQKMTLRVLRD